jgi:hypothetical protein
MSRRSVMARPRGQTEIKEISEAEAKRQLKETYADAAAAGKFFDQLVANREKALDAFVKEVNADERLAEALTRNPIGALHERKLLGPLDRITVDGLRNPFFDWPWPWPICRIVCRLELVREVHWICIGIWPLRLCWPVFHIHLRWVCRTVCD